MPTETRFCVYLAGTLLVCSLAVQAAENRLIDAVRNDDTDSARSLLSQHADPNAKQGDGSTPLHWAAHRDNLALAELLIRNGANVNAANDDGATPLYLACTNRSSAVVERLLSAGANANARLPNGETVLMNCARTGDAKAVKALLTHHADPNAKESAHQQTALMWAAAEKHPEVTALLLEFGADLSARSLIYSQTVVDEQTQRAGREKLNYDVKRGGETALLFAARNGDLESARLLLARGANVNDRQADGLTAVGLAVYSGQGPVGILLLDRGADPNVAEIGYTALHAAVLRSQLDLVKALLAHKADPNAKLTKGTPIRRDNTDFNLPKTLLGATPYLLAAKFCEPAIMQALAAGGADIRMMMPNGANALLLAAGLSSSPNGSRRGVAAIDFGKAEPEPSILETVTMAVKLGADVNSQNPAGETALHTAASQGRNSVIRFLVANGARLDTKNRQGQTALAAALSANRRPRPVDDAGADVASPGRADTHENTVALLRSLGAKE